MTFYFIFLVYFIAHTAFATNYLTTFHQVVTNFICL